MGFSLDDKLVFIDSFQFLSSSLDSSIENLGENDFRHLSQEFDGEVSHSVKWKRFYTYKYMCDFKKFKEKLPEKNEFYSSLSGKGIGNKKYQHVLKVWNKFEMKTMKTITICT